MTKWERVVMFANISMMWFALAGINYDLEKTVITVLSGLFAGCIYGIFTGWALAAKKRPEKRW